jgi:hypothetical protein
MSQNINTYKFEVKSIDDMDKIIKNPKLLKNAIQTEELCLNLVENNCECIKYVENITDELYMKFFELNPYCIEYMNNVSQEILYLAVKNNIEQKCNKMMCIIHNIITKKK